MDWSLGVSKPPSKTPLYPFFTGVPLPGKDLLHTLRLPEYLPSSRFNATICMRPFQRRNVPMGKELRGSVRFFRLQISLTLGGWMMRLPFLNGYIAPGDYKYPALIFPHPSH